MSRAGSQVRAVYDFSGEPGTAELSIASGEVLTLTERDVGEGWSEGVNDAGETGLFPAAYVEEYEGSQPPAMPPPSLPYAFPLGPGPDHLASSAEAGDYWEDDDWDDDQEPSGTGLARDRAFARSFTSRTSHIARPGSMDADDSVSLGKGEVKTSGGGASGRKNFNRFSGFGKAGLENFILSFARLEVADAERFTILEASVGVAMWNPIRADKYYSCVVASPKKESKLKGLKSYIAYQITPSFNNIQVSRRYKHFDWLHERLEEKFSLIPIPPLPDKQISGRYEGQFIEHRRAQLQAFVRAVCRHPVLSRCSVWMHFLTCTDEKRWKIGKRKEEKDKLLGANYFYSLDVPQKPLSVEAFEVKPDSCALWMHKLDTVVKLMMATAADQAKKHQGPYKREYQKIGHSFIQLSSVLKVGETDERLCSAVKCTGDMYNDIGTLFEEQPKLDWEPLGDTLHICKGLIGSFPDILAEHKGAVHKRKESEKLATENKMDEPQIEEVKRRTDIVSYALLAEINHFCSEQSMDIKDAMKIFLSQQINFYQKVVNKLQDALETFE